MYLLSQNTKSNKTNAFRNKYLTYFMQLAPTDISGYNVCPSASPTCRKDCLFYSGFGVYKPVQNGRIRKTRLFFEDRESFKKLLFKDLESVIRITRKLGKRPCVRLNSLSDLPFEKLIPDIFNYPILFYDYTKIKKKYKDFLDDKLPKNYHLTFSRSEKNEKDCLDFLNQGGTIAVVGHKRPRQWNGFNTIDGDKHDLRFLMKSSQVCWLTPKGKMKYDLSGFVIR